MSRQDLLIDELREVLNKLSWLNGQKMKSVFSGFSASEVHCIEYIGSHQDTNVTMLAEAFYQTRGGISKITHKLSSKDVIERYQRPDNQKEIYFRLTTQGKTIYHTHAKLHMEFRERDSVVFNQMNEVEFDTIFSFMTNYSRHLDAEMAKQDAKT